jgi:hypothetical protein
MQDAHSYSYKVNHEQFLEDDGVSHVRFVRK